MPVIRAVCLSAAAVVLVGCGSSREVLSVAPRPELVEPPGEMATQRLVLMKALSEAAKPKNIGSISLAVEGVGVLARIDVKGLEIGSYVLTMNENADCSESEVEGKTILAGSAGAPWGPEDKPVQIPSLRVSDDGALRTEVTMRGLTMSDTKGRSLVLSSGGRRVACGVAI